MADEKEQTATNNADGQSETGTEDKGAPENKGSDLEASLAEYDEAMGKGSTEQLGDKKKVDEPDLSARIERMETQTNNRDLGDAIKIVRTDFGSDEVSDSFVKIWMLAQAQDDPRIDKAWDNRHVDPKKFERVLAGLATKFAQENARLRKTDADATADHEAVAQAVRSKGTKGSEGKAPDFSKMTDQQLREYEETHYNY